jgi:hypothetical protein
MKKLLIIGFIISGLSSCLSKELGEEVPTITSEIKVEMLSKQINHGLYKITIDDTTQILIYRGIESCTMIRLK